MEKVKNIEKFVKQKSTQGYEGYLDTLVYFRQFDDKQLDYIETYEKAEIKATDSLLKFLELITLGIAMIALLVEAFPEIPFDNSKDLNLPDGIPQHYVSKLEKHAALKVLLDETLTNLQEAQVLPLEDNDIVLLRNGEPETANYSICPIYTEPLQKYIIEKELEFKKDPPKPDNSAAPKIPIPPPKDKGKDKNSDFPDTIFEPGPQGPKKPEILKTKKEKKYDYEIEM